MARVSFLKKWCFAVNFAKFLRIPFSYGTPPVAASGTYGLPAQII